MGSEHRYKFIVGVDYGTTGTAISIAITENGQCGSISFVNNWPPNNDFALKVPSEVSYLGDHGSPRWGFEVQPGMHRCSWTKLLLDKDANPMVFDDQALQVVVGSGMLYLPVRKGAVTVVTDFLREIYRRIDREIRDNCHIRQPRIRLPVPVDFWFTVPAVWSEQAKSLMEQAVRGAGFGSRRMDRLFTIAGPEAAALSVFHNASADLKPHDGLMVCDLGGGTVFEQLTAATGAKCGGVAVDCQLYKLLSKELGADFDSKASSLAGQGSELMETFKSIKRRFSDREEETHALELDVDAPNADPSFYNGNTHLVTLRGCHLRSLFDPVVDDILRFTISQVAAANQQCKRNVITKIAIVGGFACVPYVMNRACGALRQILGVMVLPYHDHLTAVAGGAALRGLQGQVPPTFKCWRYLGLASALPYQIVHRLVDDPGSGSQEADWELCWVLNKDQRYQRDWEKTVAIHLHHPQNGPLVNVIRVYECNSASPPQSPSSPDVRHIGLVQCSFVGVDLSRYPHQNIRGVMWYQLEILVKISFARVGRTLHLVASTLGKEVGRHDLVMGYE